jgi:hypothetical protein
LAGVAPRGTARTACMRASVIAINHWLSIESDKLMNGG